MCSGSSFQKFKSPMPSELQPSVGDPQEQLVS